MVCHARFELLVAVTILPALSLFSQSNASGQEPAPPPRTMVGKPPTDPGPGPTFSPGTVYNVAIAPLGGGRWGALRYVPATGASWKLDDGAWQPIAEPHTDRPAGGPFIVKLTQTAPGRLAALRMNTTTGQSWELDDNRWRPIAETRFIDRGDYVEDTQTGLLWQKDGAASGKLNFYRAAEYAATLKLGGLSGWRVPTRAELAGIFPATQPPFTNTKYTEAPCCSGPHEWNSYWTSERDTRLHDYAYVYQWYAQGGANNCYASKNFVYVRCVHDPLERPTGSTVPSEHQP